jgi:hypothetical protein
MRTTLDIDDDVLAATKELARRENSSAGRVVSRLLRDILTQGVRAATKNRSGKSVGGFRPLPPGKQVVTNEQVNALRDMEGV